VQPEENDDDARHHRQLALVGLDPLTEHRRAGAEADEHGGKPENEEYRSQHHPAPERLVDLLPAGQLVEGGAAQIGEVRRHQRQHAGREEARQAGNGDPEVNVCLCEHFGLGGLL
jgi:hypothetical protein